MPTIDETRLANLARIVDEDFGGSKAALARSMEVAPNNIPRYFSTQKGRRNISDEAARLIEEAADKPVGWLDIRYMGTDDPELEELYLEAKMRDPKSLKALLHGYIQGIHGRKP